MPVPDRHDADEGPFDIARDASEFSVHGSGAFLVSVVRHPTLRRFSAEEEVFSDDLPQHII